MKLIHLSDLHIGKRLNEYSMLEEQEHILREIVRIIDVEQPDAVLIAGDVYDKAVPSAEAVQLFDRFLCQLAGQQVFLISGNHDSPERIAFGGRLMAPSGIHISPVYDGTAVPITLFDSWGPVDFFLLPFIRPVHVRRFFPEESVESYTDALRVAIRHMEVDPAHRSVLITHQFVTGAQRSASEELSVGGADNVDVSVFAPFDYVALGHIHGAQSVARPTVRYCGTPLKYSFSEAGHTKSVTVAELADKGRVTIRTVPLLPRRDLREIRGTFAALTGSERAREGAEDYLHITLTDEEDIPDAMGKLRRCYPNLLKLDYDNQRTRANAQIGGTEQTAQKSPLALFAEFFEKQNNRPMTDAQYDCVRLLMEELQEEET